MCELPEIDALMHWLILDHVDLDDYGVMLAAIKRYPRRAQVHAEIGDLEALARVTNRKATPLLREGLAS
jgi:hypothetical protein